MRLSVSSLAFVAGLAIAVGCRGDSTAPIDPVDPLEPSAVEAARGLSQIADSLESNGGDPAEISAFRGLANVVLGNGRLSSATITVDGEAHEFLATAQQFQFSSGCPIDAFCSTIAYVPRRSFMAWQKDNPRRFIQLTSSDDGAFGGAAAADSGAIWRNAHLLYFDGRGRIYSATSGSQSIAVTPSESPCVSHDERQLAIYAPAQCTLADFLVAFDGVATRLYVPFAQRGDGAMPASHTLAMAAQSVHGASIVVAPPCVSCADSTVPPPVVVPPMQPPAGDSLTATLSVAVGTDVTLTFTVTNANGAPATIQFPSAQQYDFRIWNENGGALVWRWGADKAFAQVVSSRTLGAGESVTYVEHWTPAPKGSYRASAYLTSSSHGAASVAPFTVP